MSNSHWEVKRRNWKVLTASSLILGFVLMVGILFISKFLTTSRQERVLSASYITAALAFSPTGEVLAGGEGSSSAILKLWNVNSGQSMRTISTKHNAAIDAVAFSPDGKMTATCGHSDGRVFLWDVSTGKRLTQLTGSQSKTTSLFFSSDARFLINAGVERQGTVEIWDVQTRKLKHQLREFEGNVFASLGVDEKALITVSRSGLQTWSLETGELLRSWSNKIPQELVCVAFSSDRNVLALGVYSKANQKTRIEIWNMKSGQFLYEIPEKSKTQILHDHSNLKSLALSPNGGLLAISRWQEEVALWNVTTRKLQREFEPWATSLAFSPDGKTLAIGTQHEVRLWNVAAVLNNEDNP